MNQNNLKIIKILTRYGFKYFYKARIRYSNYFADDGLMDWLIGKWILAFPKKINKDILKRCKVIVGKQSPELMGRENHSIFLSKWNLKFNNTKILPVDLENDIESYYSVGLENNNKNYKDAFKKVLQSVNMAKYFEHYDVWYLLNEENIILGNRLYLDKAIKTKKLNFKIIKKI